MEKPFHIRNLPKWLEIMVRFVLLGGVNNKNPFHVIIPFQCVVGADGSLTGYTGGLKRKLWLLEFKRCF